MTFRVTKQFARGQEITLETFPKYEVAVNFIQQKLEEDSLYKVETTYRIYDDLDEMLKEYTPADVKAKAEYPADRASGQGSGKSQTFSPTPFNLKPQPKGLPHTWLKDDDEKENKDK